MRTRQASYPSPTDGITFTIRPLLQKRRAQSVDDRCSKVSRRASACGMDAIPDDLLVSIVSFVGSAAASPADLVNAMLTCRRFCAATAHPQVLARAALPALAVKASSWSDGAYRFLKRCADAGNVEACYILGMIHFYCLSNRSGGASLMAKAAMSSHSFALHSLAVIQFNGSGGTRKSKDLKAGVALCARAASLGHVDAMRELGHCLQDGYGVAKNVAEGRRLLLEANAREAAAAVGAASARSFVETVVQASVRMGAMARRLDSAQAKADAIQRAFVDQTEIVADESADQAAVVAVGSSADRAAAMTVEGSTDRAGVLAGEDSTDQAAAMTGGGSTDRDGVLAGEDSTDRAAALAVGSSTDRAAAMTGEGSTDRAGVLAGEDSTDRASVLTSEGSADRASVLSFQGRVDQASVLSFQGRADQATVLAGGGSPDRRSILRLFHTTGFSLLSDFGCNVPPPKLHAANAFLIDWFDLHPPAASALRLCSHANCGRPETRKHEFRRCSACGTVNYCSRACQALDWKIRHKHACRLQVANLITVAGNQLAFESMDQIPDAPGFSQLQ